MSLFEIAATVGIVLTLIVVLGSVFQVRAILREVRSEGRETRGHLSAGVERIDLLEQALLQALRESLQGHTAAAVETIAQAEALPQPHRHIWQFSSEEKTNGEVVKFFVCSVHGCRDVYRQGDADPILADEGGE